MAEFLTTTTTRTSTSTRTGTQLVVDTNLSTVNMGDQVTDVSLQPYIASRIVGFYASNMRPNQRLHIFFDSVLVDEFCAPCAVPTSYTSDDHNSLTRTGTWGTAIYSDANGKVAGHFNIPEGRFKTGDRVLQISDVDNIVLGSDAKTTIASAVFTASNLNVTKQTQTLTTVNPELRVVPTTNTVVTVNVTQNTVFIPDPPPPPPPEPPEPQRDNDPLAQALTINTPNDQSGIFATSLEIYFKQKSPISSRGVTVFLTETKNGYPDGATILPFSTVHKENSQILVDATTASSATKFTFESPVYLADGKTYAFVIKPDANDPDFWLWTAELGDLDVSSGYQVFSQPVLGTAFYGATTTQWTALQTEYVKFKLNRADFLWDTGDAVFTNANTDYITIFNISYANASASILPGDRVYQASNSLANSTGSTVNTSVYGTVSMYDSSKSILYIANSTGGFTSNAFVQIHRFANGSVSTANSSTQVAYANTDFLVDPIVDAIVPQFATIVPPGTTASFYYSGTSNAYVLDSTAGLPEKKVIPGYESEFYDKQRIVASRSNEIAGMSGNKSLKLRARMTTDSSYLSPVIDTVKINPLVISNVIDPLNTIYDEFYNTGFARSKYISQVITLAEGQDAQDLEVILTAFRPPSSDIQVWVKFLSSEDPDTINNKTWTPMRNNGDTLYSDPSNPSDMREFSFKTPISFAMFPTSGTITCTNVSTSVTGSSTFFQTEIGPGWYINMAANSTFNEQSRQVVSVASNTALTLEAPFNGNYSGASYYVVPPPTTAYLSANTSTKLTGTVSANTTSNIITGSGTAFNTELTAQSIISINGDQQKVVSITNSTHLAVGTPWSSTISGANGYNVTPAGVTYYNKSNQIFSTFKRFQIKIVFQSDDSSKVPIVDDLRAIALQL